MTSTTTAPQLRRYRLADNLEATSGAGLPHRTQALIRLVLMQAGRDAARGIASRGFVSGYRGSPLGMVDQQAWRAHDAARAAGMRFLPAINEELARPRCWARSGSSPTPSARPTASTRCGTARAPASTVPATRSSTATPTARRRTAACWSSPATTTAAFPRRCRTRATAPSCPGTCRSSRRRTSPSTWSSASTAGSCRAFPATGSASPRSRRSSRAARPSTSTKPRAASPPGGRRRTSSATGYRRPADGLHYRWPDLPSLKIEERACTTSSRRCAPSPASTHRPPSLAPQATVGIVTCGKAHLDLLEVFRRLDIPLAALARRACASTRSACPSRSSRPGSRASPQGSTEILVIEEKGAVVETQLRDLFYNARGRGRRSSASATPTASRWSPSSASCGRRG